MNCEYDIAIVGMACRFPGARNLAEFWQNLVGGVESISRLGDREMIDAGVSAAWLSRPNYVKAAPVLDDPALFDAAFFGYSPVEAATMDPQHRVLLELAHAALEDAACDPERYRGRIGVFTGSAMNTYFANRGLNAKLAEEYIPTLIVNDKDFLSTRISYKLGLRGPSLTVQTACSTSLVAVHLARQSLLSKETDMALAGAVSVRVPHRAGYFHDGAGVVSADGHVRAFDAAANGTVFGSGAGVVVLKRLEDALTEGDHIYAVVKGSAVNNDGSRKAGYTAPSVDGQAEVIVEALANAGLDAGDISYIEAHGSGTPVGDPIEILALTKAFRHFTQRRGYCAIGSVKTNLGHLDAAAGMAGLIKAALALKHRQIPPSLHYAKPNPEIDFPSTPFFVNTQVRDWKPTTGPCRAGVMSTGMGGTNAHVVLEEAPAFEAVEDEAPPHLLVLSAKTPAALDAMSRNLADFLAASPVSLRSAGPSHRDEADRRDGNSGENGSPDSGSLGDVAHTLQTGRGVFPHRRFAVCRDTKEAVVAFGTVGSKKAISGQVANATRRPVFFLLPGVGDHYVGMGQGLYERFDVFRREIDRCAGILHSHLGLDIREILYPRDRVRKDPAKSSGIDLKKMLGRAEQDAGDPAAQILGQTRYCQPALFTVEYALAQLWMDWGVRPDRLVGHSMGEYVAACLSGVFSLEDALRLVAFRARLVNELPLGAMLAIALPEDQVRTLLNEQLSISLINGPNLCVVAGPVQVVAELGRLLTDRGVSFRPVKNAHAFHSRMLDPIVGEYEEEIRKIRLNKPQIPYVSNVTGGWISDGEATDPVYWTTHANHTARFGDALQTMWRHTDALLVEVGPGKGLGTIALQHPARQHAADPVAVSSLPPHYDNVSDAETMLTGLGRLWLCGAGVDWDRLRQKAKRRRISLPAYPFERRRHWIESSNGDSPAPVSPGTPAGEFAVAGGDAAVTLIDSTDGRIQPRAAMTPSPIPASDVDRRKKIAERLKALIKELSGIEVTSDTVSFMELGFESLFLTQASQLFQSKFGVKISFRQMLGDLSTVAALAGYLDEQLPPETNVPVNAAPTVAAPPPAAAQYPPQAAGGSVLEQLLTQQVQLMQMLLKQPGALPPASVVPTAPAPTDGLRAVKEPAGASRAAGPQSLDPRSKRFGPYKPVEKGEKGNLTPRQQNALDRLIERYVKRTAGSKRYTTEHRAHFADPRAVAGFNSNWKEMVYPIVSERSKGSKIWDIDGNEYVDITMGFGIYLFGHSPDWLMAALQEQMKTGIEIGPQSLLAGKVARLICEFTGMERVTFCNTGSEAVMAAIRLARVITGRRRVVFFSGDYHGIFEEVLVRGAWLNGQYRSQPAAPGIPENLVENILVLDYGTPEALQIIKEHADEIAAVLVEPVRSRQPGFQPREFMHELRELTEQTGAALIFDEMVTGFRCHPGGAQAYFGVRADMATFGKVIGAGIPIGILAGKGKFLDALDGGMWNYGDDSFPEVGMTYFAGTFVRHPLALAASWRALNYLKEEGPKLQLRMAERVGRFCRTLNEYFEQRNVPISLPHFASFATIEHAPDLKFMSLLWYFLREKGALAWENRTCYFTVAHTDDDFDRLVTAFKESVREMQEGGFLPESPPSTVPPGGISHSGSEFPRDDTAPLTEAQREMILAAIMDDAANCVYNQSITIHFRGPLNVPAMEKSIEHLFDRHPALRSTFSPDFEAQFFHQDWTGRLAVIDLSALPESEQTKRLEQQASEEMTTPFDLAKGPVIRLCLFKSSAESHRLILTAHHLVCDGWSTSMLVFDLSRIYNALVAGRIPLLPPPMSFAEFARQQAGKKADAAYQATEEFWLNQYAEKAPVLNLPTDRPRPLTRTFAGSMESRPVDPGLFARLKKATPHLGGTVFATLFGVCATLLHRLTSQDDLVIGVPAAGQAAFGCADLVGHCMNFLPIRVRLSAEQTFQEFAQSVKTTILNAYEHQNYTYGTLIQKLKLPRDPGRPPLVSAIFNIDKSGFDVFGFDHLTYTVTANAKRHVNFDVFFNLVQTETSLEIGCEYNNDLFERETIVRWLDQFERLIEAVVADASATLDSLPLLSEREKTRLLVEWNQTTAPHPEDRTLHGLIEEQVAKTPGAVALEFAGKHLTYRQLDKRANKLAHRLRSLGVGPNVLVAVSLDRSLEMVVALLAILKAGGAYVPIDPDYPPARRSFMLQDSGVRLLLTQQALLPKFAPPPVNVLCVDHDWDEIEKESDRPPGVSMSPADLAYTIYTSGSTGKPKGVQIEHRAVVNFLDAMRRAPGLGAEDVLLAVTTLSFDIAGLELYLPLTTGAKIVLASREVAADGEALLRFIEQHRVTVLQATPVTWRLLLAAGWKRTPQLKALCGGEALPADLAADLLPRCAELWNMYGPTETTVWSTCAHVTDAADIHIGRPIDNTEIYILDANRQPLPIGVAGELLIGGAGLARGYLNRSELTAEKFVPHPFKPGQRLYRTGDLARYRNDGTIDCLGRLDFQVKIRGFRIELGEIEAQLAAHPQVKQTVVVAREDMPGDPRLVAYVAAPSAAEPPSIGELREHLRARLPEYMIPSAFVLLDTLPLTPNGKIDRKALPAPEVAAVVASKTAVPPRNATEKRLMAIFEEVLKARVASVEDNFFELGGHSILAARLMASIEKDVGIRLPLATLLKDPTIEGIAMVLGDASKRSAQQGWSPLVRIQPKGTRPPLFLVHGAGGNVLLYRDLALRLGDEQPLYGLQAVGLDGKTSPLATVEEMAQTYLPYLRRIQPSGPYHLGGYCMGGMVAYEMARHLVEEGKSVALLALLDTYNLSTIANAHAGSGSQLFQRLRFHLGNLAQLRPGELAGYLKEKVRIAKDGELANILGSVFGSSYEPGTGSSSAPGKETVQEANDRAATLFRPRPFGGKVTVFRPQMNYDLFPDSRMGWGDLTSGGVEVVELAVNPHGMLVEPFVKQLAGELRRQLSSVAGRPADAETTSVALHP